MRKMDWSALTHAWREVSDRASEVSQRAKHTVQKLSEDASLSASESLAHIKHAYFDSDDQLRNPSEEEYAWYGVTEDVVAFAKALTLRTFKDTHKATKVVAPKVGPYKSAQEHQGPWQLTVWQEIHARMLLKLAPELNDLRHVLCPRRMPESTFWHVRAPTHHISYFLGSNQAEFYRGPFCS